MQEKVGKRNWPFDKFTVAVCRRCRNQSISIKGKAVLIAKFFEAGKTVPWTVAKLAGKI